MRYRKCHTKVAAAHHRRTLPVVLYMAAALLIINAWLVSQQLPGL